MRLDEEREDKGEVHADRAFDQPLHGLGLYIACQVHLEFLQQRLPVGEIDRLSGHPIVKKCL